MHPINDQIKVMIATDAYGFGGNDEKDGSESGIAVEMPDKLNYFGFHSFAFENSFMAEEELSKLYDYYSSLIGKRVYWKAFSERGMVLKQDGNDYAFIKMTDLIAYSEVAEEAQGVEIKNGGAFRV